MNADSLSLPIHHTFGPLATDAQAKLVRKLLKSPWSWRSGKSIELLRQSLSSHFGRSASLFGRGRDALFAALHALDLKFGDEVIIQGFTCAVVPNAVHAMKATPVFCDIDPGTLSFNMDQIQRFITPRTKAILCQHTFGIPAHTERLRAICNKRDLVLIEDCAHVIPDSLSAEESSADAIGVHGDIVILSFGRDKAISGVTGGAALTHHPELAEKLSLLEQSAIGYTFWHIHKLISYPVRYRLAKAMWRCGFGKLYLKLLQLSSLLPPILSRDEKKGLSDGVMYKLPNGCAALAHQQMQSLREINAHRRRLTGVYLSHVKERGYSYPDSITEEMPLQKFPIFIKEPHAVRVALKQKGVYLDDGWCGAVVNPRSVDQESAGYARGMCPTADDVATHILSLPTHPTMKQDDVPMLMHFLRAAVSSS